MNKSVLALTLATGVTGITLRKASKVATSEDQCSGVIENFGNMMKGNKEAPYTPGQEAAYDYLCNQHRTETGNCILAGLESDQTTVSGKAALGWGTMCAICPAAHDDPAWKCAEVKDYCKDPFTYTCDNADDAGACLLVGLAAAAKMYEDHSGMNKTMTLMAELQKGKETMCKCDDLPHKSEWQC